MTEYWVFQDKSFKRAWIHRSNCGVRQAAMKPDRSEGTWHGAFPTYDEARRKASVMSPKKGAQLNCRLCQRQTSNQGKAPMTTPAVRFDSRSLRGPTRMARWGMSSGSGGARLDLSQKGNLPSSGERLSLCGSKVADARKSHAERRLRGQGPTTSLLGPRGVSKRWGNHVR